MSERYETLAARIQERFGEQVTRIPSHCGELTYEVDKDDLVSVATALRNEGDFGFGWNLVAADGNIRETVPAGESFYPETRVYIDSPETGQRIGFIGLQIGNNGDR